MSVTPLRPAPACATHELGEVESLQTCLKGFSDLLCPDGSIENKTRDHVAYLLDFLIQEQERRIDALRAVVQGKTP